METHLNFVEFNRHMAGTTGGVLVEEGGVACGLSGEPFPSMANWAIRTDASVDAAAAVARADAFFRDCGHGYTFFARIPGDEEVEEIALSAGFLALIDMPEMVCEARPDDTIAPEGVTLRWVEHADDVAAYFELQGLAYSTLGFPTEVLAAVGRHRATLLDPHVGAVVAEVDGRPVAGAMALLSDGVGGVYFVGTVEAARGRGLGELVTRAVTNWAFDRGAARVCLQASHMGEPIYRRMGYRHTSVRYRGPVRFEPGG
jgi:GNAT superfamily N-acetyltransferase